MNYLFQIMGMIGPGQIILILVIILLLFGGRKLPELMKGLGQGLKEFKKATKDDQEPEGTENDNKAENKK